VEKARYLLVAMEWVNSNTTCLYRINKTERSMADSIVGFKAVHLRLSCHNLFSARTGYVDILEDGALENLEQ
jgi:hypothetical protein